MAKNDSYAGQLIDEIKQLKEENEKLKRNYKIAMINLAECRDEIDELEEQIAMMKCCENCKEYSETYRTCCRDTHSEMCIDSSKWEMKE